MPVDTWSIERLRALSQVSRVWRRAVLETPEMWAVARVRAGLHSWHQDLLLALKRSRNCPLVVDYSSETRHDQAPEFMKIVTGHSRRWRTLSFDGVLSKDIAASLEQPVPLWKNSNYVMLVHRPRLFPHCACKSDHHSDICDSNPLRSPGGQWQDYSL